MCLSVWSVIDEVIPCALMHLDHEQVLSVPRVMIAVFTMLLSARSPVCRHVTQREHARLRCFTVRPDASGAAEDALGWTEVMCPPGGRKVQDASGNWRVNEEYAHKLDRGLLREYITLFDNASLTEFGAGKGCYSAAMLTSGRLRSVHAFDSTRRNIAAMTRGLVQFADVSTRGQLFWRSGFGRRAIATVVQSDWLLSTEVGEIIPPTAEETYFDHVAAQARVGAVLSWCAASPSSSAGCSSLRTNAHVAARMGARGLCLDVRDSVRLSRAALGGGHVRSSSSVYRRRCPQEHAPCCRTASRAFALTAIINVLDALGLRPWDHQPRVQQYAWRAAASLLVLVLVASPCACLCVVARLRLSTA